MSSLVPGLGNLPLLLVKEAKRHMVLVSTLFAVVASGALVIGMLWPKTWECSALLEPDPDTIKRLVEGQGARNSTQNQVAATIQTVKTRKIMHEILAFGGWLEVKRSPQEEEILLAKLRSRLQIEGARDDMIRIGYRDTDSERTFLITNKVVEIMIREAASAKETSSRETYEFLERQVKEYSKELTSAHENLLAYYRGQGPRVAAPESEGPAPRGRRVTNSSQPPRMSLEEVAALRAEEATLTAQLARDRPAAPPPADSRRAEEQLRARVQQLGMEYEHLANSYTDRHPDVVRKKVDLDAAREDLQRLEAARLEKEKARAETSALDEEVGRAARLRLEEVRALLGSGAHPSTSGRSRSPRPSPVISDTELVDREMRRVGQDSKLSELLRRYETTRDVYQDLLKKREAARLSLNLDVERSSFILRVREPPRMPVFATGLRVMHRSMIGMMLAVAVPLGVLFALISLDGRARSTEQIERVAKVPILVSIPYAPSAEGDGRARLRKVLSLLLVAGVFVAYVVAYLLTKTRVAQ